MQALQLIRGGRQRQLQTPRLSVAVDALEEIDSPDLVVISQNSDPEAASW